jgi:hypothetical protein
VIYCKRGLLSLRGELVDSIRWRLAAQLPTRPTLRHADSYDDRTRMFFQYRAVLRYTRLVRQETRWHEERT